MAEKETQIDSDNKEIKELKQKIVTMSEKLRCTEQSLIEQKHLVKEKDGKIVVSTLILKKEVLQYLISLKILGGIYTIDLLTHFINYNYKYFCRY